MTNGEQDGAAQPMPWKPLWILPNVAVEESFETSFVALVRHDDERIRLAARARPAIGKLLRSFRSEFRDRVDPSVLIVRDEAPETVFAVGALSGFRDAIAVSALAEGNAMLLASGRPSGITYADAFDIYPWAWSRDYDETMIALTPGISALHLVEKFRGQISPAIPNRQLAPRHVDQVLLTVLLERWEAGVAVPDPGDEHRRLFRAIDMARNASRQPGGTDATIHDAGRSMAQWVSAFEILTRMGDASLGRVLDVLEAVSWINPKLAACDRSIRIKKKDRPTNPAGFLYGRLHRARNRFLHGEPVDREVLYLERNGLPILLFAPVLFRMALAHMLDVYPSKDFPPSKDEKRFARAMAAYGRLYQQQLTMENAIAKADKDREPDDH